MVALVCQRNSPANWQDEAMDAMADIEESIARGEFTCEEWIKALA